jgi:PAS domain S-box-containing protein
MLESRKPAPENRDSTGAARRLTLLYIIALGTVGMLSITGQVLVQELIGLQRDDSKVINVAGRQRMLSQRIAKSALALERALPEGDNSARRDELAQALAEWEDAHAALVERDGKQGLQGTNSENVIRRLTTLEAPRAAIVDSANQVLQATAQSPVDAVAVRTGVAAILDAEPNFLVQMDAIVDQYEVEARARVARLRRVELVLLAITLTVLLIEGFFIFRPAAARIRKSFARLSASEREREAMAAEVGTIFDSVPALILYHDRDGRIIRVNRPGAEIIGESLYKLHHSSVYELFPGDTSRFREEDAWILDHGQPRLGLLHLLRNSQGGLRWLRMNKVPYRDLDQNVAGIIIFAVDVTGHKQLERRLMELRADEERRLGYDLHDGLGQHLSGILYISRRLQNRLRGSDHPEADQAGEVVRLVKESVETVRTLSKGLRPLGDEPEALVTALGELAAKTTETTGIQCVFEEDGKALFFEQDVAEHLYRIAQEAIGNAIRHSGARHITIRLHQGDDETVLEVRDDGAGLPPGVTTKHGSGNQGLGLSIMEHRSELLGGVFTLDAAPDGGVTVRCALKT